MIVPDSYDRSFRCMGCDVRLLIEADDGTDVQALGEHAERFLRHVDHTLSRFDATSELSALNADPRTTVPASALLRSAVATGVWAAERTGGLVDPTLLAQLEDAGYRRSMAGAAPAPLRDALRVAPRRRPARPHPKAAWRQVSVSETARTVTRPAGLRLDSGGFGKGLAADTLATMLAGVRRFAVDCAGDVAVGGRDRRPFEIEVQHPLTGEIVHSVTIALGGIATSGLDRHVWRRDGAYAHHLLDPSTGRPAWTGLVGATAVATSTVEAETLAKAALLSGPAGGRDLLGPNGGVLFADDGSFAIVEPSAPVVRVSARALARYV